MTLPLKKMHYSIKASSEAQTKDTSNAYTYITHLSSSKIDSKIAKYPQGEIRQDDLR